MFEASGWFQKKANPSHMFCSYSIMVFILEPSLNLTLGNSMEDDGTFYLFMVEIIWKVSYFE